MEIGLPEVVKFCARKMIKRTHFMSPSKMINLHQDAMRNLSPKNMNCIGRGVPQGHKRKVSRRSVSFLINKLQLKFKNHWFLRLRISMLMSGNVNHIYILKYIHHWRFQFPKRPCTTL